MKPLFVLLCLTGIVCADPSARIDELLEQQWTAKGVKAGEIVSDEVFLRRIYLDVAGRIPTLEEARRFLAATQTDKRARLIDELLAGDGHGNHLFTFFADLLRLTDNGGKSAVVARAYVEWVKAQLRADRPYDEMVRETLSSYGMAYETGAVGYFARDENLLDNVAYTAQIFLGTQIICAQCHDHPFDKWKQTDYYAFAALSHGLNGNAAQSLDLLKLDGNARAAKLKAADLEVVRDSLQTVLQPLKYAGTKYDPRRRLELPHDFKYSDHKPGDVLPPRALFGPKMPAGLAEIKDTNARLTALAAWMTAPENPRFTTVIANRLWKRTFGLGLIEPVDEMTDSTVASNPALMRHLEQTMKDLRYSLRGFLRVIYNTRAYQRAAATTPPLPGEPWHFTGPLLRRMTAEQLWDSLITLRHGNVDDHVNGTNEHLNRYLAALRQLTDRVKQLGLSGVAEIAKAGTVRQREITRKVEAARAEMNKRPNPGKQEVQEVNRLKTRLLAEERDLLLTQILDVKSLDGLGFDYKPSMDRNEKKKKPADMQNMSREERQRMLVVQAGKMFDDRSSEQPSPSRPGHFLRTFGQSDRDVIENSNSDFTVPQMLNLLNGPAAEAIAIDGTPLRTALNASPDAEAKLEVLYLSLLSRLPVETERTLFHEAIRERGERAVEDFRHALLLGAEFHHVR